MLRQYLVPTAMCIMFCVIGSGYKVLSLSFQINLTNYCKVNKDPNISSGNQFNSYNFLIWLFHIDMGHGLHQITTLNSQIIMGTK